jgi:N-acyl-D-amino-acid deacylase
MSQTQLLLRGGTVHDGLGSPSRIADVLVRGDRIAAVGMGLDTSDAAVVDCSGLLVCPGFIDTHAHSDGVPLLDDPQPFKLLQGVTTEVVGNCGMSFAPLTEAAAAEFSGLYGELAPGISIEPASFADFCDRVERAGPTNNLAFLVGHNTLRLCANGTDDELRPGALESMQRLAADAFDAGAVGLSSGLIYVPGTYSDTDELAELAAVAGAYGRLYATHMRDEGTGIEAALDEAFAIGRRAGVRVEISHCKAAGRSSHGRGGAIVDRIARARREGIDVLGDQYPYTAGSTVLSALIPTSAMVGGVEAMRRRLGDSAERARLRVLADAGGSGAGLWREVTAEDVLVIHHRDAASVGGTLADLSAGREPWDSLCDLIAADPGAMIVLHLMSEADVRRIMSDPLISIGSDNGPPVGMQHPRTWGCFPRLLGTYVREEGVLTWEEAVRKATSMPARHFGLIGRGVLRAGAVADVCAVDPQTVGHRGTYLEPAAQPTGVPLVLLGGRPVVRDGAFRGERYGHVLRAGRA